MATEEGFDVPIRVTYDPSGLDAAKKDIEDAGKTAKESGEQAGMAAQGWEQLQHKLKELIALGEVIAFLRESWKELYEEEKALRAVGAAAGKYGLDQKEMTNKVRESAEAMALFAGVADNQVIRTMSKQLLITGDLEQAQARASATTLLSMRLGIDYAEAEGMITAATIGRTRSLEKKLGIIAHGTTQEEKAADAIKQMNAILAKGTTAVMDHALAYDQANTRMQIFQKQVGEQIAPSVVWLKTAFMDLVDWLTKFVAKVGAVGMGIADTFKNLGTLLVDVWKNPEKAFKEFGKAEEESSRNTKLVLEELDRDYAEKKAARTKGASLEEMLAQAKALAANKGLKGEKEKDDKEAHDFTLELLRSQVQATETAYGKLLLEYKIFAKEREQAEIEVWKVGINVAENLTKLGQIENNKRLAAEKKLRDENKKILDQISKDYADLATKRIAEEKRATDAEEQMRKHAAATARHFTELRAQGELELANRTVELGAAVFGQRKEVAVAQAIINTYEGATKALAAYAAFPPLAAAMAAIIIATGLAQVAQIVSTNPSGGGGFDDPANDMAAYRGGRKWAKDMINFFGGGATDALSRGWASGMGGGSSSTTNDNRRTYNVHLHNVGLFDPSNRGQLTRLKRGLEQLDRDVEGRLITGRS